MGGSGASAGSSSNIPAAGSSTDLSTPGAPADGAEASLVGEVLDNRYRILKKLGEGGMGEVYAAEHIHIEKKVAIKLLRPEIVSNQEAVSRFRQEARSASSIGHRNIIGIDDFGQLKDGRIYLCMELLAGAPLNDLIKETLPVDRLINILIQTGHGLAAAHKKGIVHRDMKPENIFVVRGAGGEDVPKLLDFGIAKVAGQDGQNNLTRTGTIFGTPYYMAPEQALGQGVDARVDVYAMGVIMYEVFAGSLPFQGESFMGILTQHITTDPEPVAQRAQKAGRTLPAGLPEVITHCLAKDPEKRYRSMDELVTALVSVYRTVAGSGMSSYMEAFAPNTGMMPAAQGPGPGPAPIVHAKTVMAPGSGPHSGPMNQPPGGQMHAPHGPPSGQMMPAPPYGGHGHQPPPYGGPMHPPPYAGGPPSSGVHYAAESQVAMAKPASKAGLYAVIVIVLVVIGGGIAAAVLLGGKKDKDAEAGEQLAAAGDAGGGSDVVVPAAVDAGTGGGDVVVPGAIDAGSAVEPAAIDAAAAVDVEEIDAGGGGAVDVIEPVNVLVVVSTRNAVIYANGKKLGKSPQIVKVKPGETVDVKAKAKGYKDETITVDGTEERVDLALKASGGGGGTGTGTGGTGPGTGGTGPTQSYCETHPLDPDCAQ